MAAERASCINLVAEVEKYPLLYNYKLPEYSRKDLTEKAWAEIAHKIKLTVSECKEKWRNIRSTFLRSTKAQPSGSKTKKPYYLSENLTFILPYVKPLNDSPNCGNIPPTPDTETTNIEAETAEQVSNEGPADSLDQHEPPASPVQCTSSEASATIHGVRRRKTPASEVDAAMVKFLKNKTNNAVEAILNKNEKQMNLFFLSLLPEFSDMNAQQIRSFKIKVLQLIDDIKTASSETSRDSTPCTSRESYYNVYSPISSVGTPAPINYQNEPPAQISSRVPPAPINYQPEFSPAYQNQAMPVNYSTQAPFDADMSTGSINDNLFSEFDQ